MKYDDDDDRKLIFFRFKLILMLIGPWIPVFLDGIPERHIYLTNCRLELTPTMQLIQIRCTISTRYFI